MIESSFFFVSDVDSGGANETPLPKGAPPSGWGFLDVSAGVTPKVNLLAAGADTGVAPNVKDDEDDGAMVAAAEAAAAVVAVTAGATVAAAAAGNAVPHDSHLTAALSFITRHV